MASFLAIAGSISEVIGAGEIAGTVGTGVTEVTGSALAGGAVAGEVKSGITNEINQKVKDSVDFVFGEGTSDFIAEKEKEISENIGLAFASQDPFLNIDNPSEKFKALEKPKDVDTQGKDLAFLVHEFSNEISTDPDFSIVEGKVPEEQRIKDIVKKIADNNPRLKYLIPGVLTIGARINEPNNSDYQRIKSLYNGRSLYPDTVAVREERDGNKIFFLLDEQGNPNSWVFPLFNDYTPVPTIFGIWVGINSINNSVPKEGSLLDLFAFLHDISYLKPERGGRGSFNKFGDYQLIARIQNNLDRFALPGEKEVALIAANYFSTLGSMARRLFGKNTIDPEDLKEGPRQQAQSQSQPDQQQLSGIDSTQPSQQLFGILNPNNDKNDHIKFEEAFITELDNLSKTSSVLTVNGSDFSRKVILNYLDSMNIELD